MSATFAYFSVSANNLSETTVVTGSTESVGNIILTNGTSMPSLELKAEHFAQSVGEKEYYSSPSGSPVESATYDSIIDGKVSGGEISTTYECTATLSVTVEGADSLEGHTGEAVLTLKGEAGVTMDATDTKTIDLSEYTEAETATLKFTLTGKDTASKKLVGASLMIKNTTAEQNDYLANKEFSVKAAVNSVNCEPKAAA